MRDIHHGITPNLPLPAILSGSTKDVPKPKDTPSSVKQPPSADTEKKAPAWWSRNPEVVTDWTIPEGKSMKDLFTSFSPEGKENLKLFPLMTHHNPTVTGKKAL
jgi:hypothetical protein